MEKRILKPKICHCGKEFMPKFSYQKHCSAKCRWAAKRANDNKLVHCVRCQAWERKSELRHGRCSACNRELSEGLRGEGTHFGGKEWTDIAKEIRRINGNACCICGRKPETGGIPVDHIIPRRWMEQHGLNPHIAVNLACLCTEHHGTKTGLEDYLFKGDNVGFCSELAGMNYPLGRVLAAFHAAGLNEKLLQHIYNGK